MRRKALHIESFCFKTVVARIWTVPNDETGPWDSASAKLEFGGRFGVSKGRGNL